MYTALQVVAVKANGDESPPSNEDIVNMPSMPAPILTSAQAWGPTTGQATAAAPVGVTFSQASPITMHGADQLLSGSINMHCQAKPVDPYLKAVPWGCCSGDSLRRL
jgi:hypothetical protein